MLCNCLDACVFLWPFSTWSCRQNTLLGLIIMWLITCLEIICNHSFLTVTGIPAANSTSSAAPADGGITRAGLDITTLQRDIQCYYKLGWAQSTWKSYNSSIRHYLTFCNSTKLPPVLTKEHTLLFVSYLTSLRLGYPTIKAYLSGVCRLHLSSGHHEQFSNHLTPRLHQVLKDIRKEAAGTRPARIHHPITIQIMTGIKRALLGNPQDYHNIMMRAACCLEFLVSSVVANLQHLHNPSSTQTSTYPYRI